VKAVITAGGPIDGAYAEMAGTNLKALAPVRGHTMLGRTIAVLRECGVAGIAVVGNEEIARACAGSVERIVPDAGSGSRNVLAALSAWPQDGDPLLYLTCDMPYIEAPAIRSFLDAVAPDTLAMPLTERDAFVARFPDAPPFGITLGGETVVNGGVFHIPAGAADRIRTFATRLFEARKAPWRMATIAGPALLVRFAFGRLTIAQLEVRARAVLSLPVKAVRDAAPELAYDADTVDEYRYAVSHD
jgi:GTP:adenosylcobinamide-phosphate guanylyltransferase